MIMPKPKSLRNSEDGFASIVIALILIIVLALLTVGFAQLARREQATSLNKQLAIQANYAAESGINDAIIDIKNSVYTAAKGNTSFNRCMTPPAGSATSNNTIDSGTQVLYTCLLIDLSPNNLQFNITAYGDKYTTFQTSSALRQMTFAWGSTNTSSATFPTSAQLGQFTPHSNWGNFPPVLQVTLTPYSAGNFSRSNLINNSFTTYLYPSSSGTSSINYSAGNIGSSINGPIISGQCSNVGYQQSGSTYPCQATINNLSGSNYSLQLISYYKDANVDIVGQDNIGNSVNFIKAQAKIDVTGEAKSVLKRLEVRYPYTQDNNNLPPFALNIDNLCKRQQTDPSSTTFWDTNGSQTTTSSDPCYLQ